MQSAAASATAAIAFSWYIPILPYADAAVATRRELRGGTVPASSFLPMPQARQPSQADICVAEINVNR
jgi:hypothetical protein